MGQYLCNQLIEHHAIGVIGLDPRRARRHEYEAVLFDSESDHCRQSAHGNFRVTYSCYIYDDEPSEKSGEEATLAKLSFALSLTYRVIICIFSQHGLKLSDGRWRLRVSRGPRQLLF